MPDTVPELCERCVDRARAELRNALEHYHAWVLTALVTPEGERLPAVPEDLPPGGAAVIVWAAWTETITHAATVARELLERIKRGDAPPPGFDAETVKRSPGGQRTLELVKLMKLGEIS